LGRGFLRAQCLLYLKYMKFVCRHCDEFFDDEAYRVISVDNDEVLLNMIVCAHCAVVARELKLATQKIDLSSRPETVSLT